MIVYKYETIDDGDCCGSLRLSPLEGREISTAMIIKVHTDMMLKTKL